MYKTKSKEKLYNFFNVNKDKSYSANELVEIFNGDMDKSTIYRQLIKFENSNILCKKYNSRKEINEYQFVETKNELLQLTCNKCGKIIKLKCEIANNFMVHILSDHGFNIDNFKSTIYGLCKECE